MLSCELLESGPSAECSGSNRKKVLNQEQRPVKMDVALVCVCVSKAGHETDNCPHPPHHAL